MSLLEIDTQAPDQLHLYAHPACPFCHRVLAALALTGLGDAITITCMQDVKRQDGWRIDGTDPVFGATRLAEVYAQAEPDGTHRPAVPLLIDKRTARIASTSSSEMVRFVSTGFNGSKAVDRDLAPRVLRPRIDRLNRWLHDHVNRAVYGVGFSEDQTTYEGLVGALFGALDQLDRRLSRRSYLIGETLTESDLYLFATLVRFDSVYHPLFKCSLRRIADYPNLASYMARMLAIPELAATVDHDRIKRHYFRSLIHTAQGVRNLNPSGVIPLGPEPIALTVLHAA